MKPIRSYFRLLLLPAFALSFTACNDSILDLTPPSTLTEVNFYKTAADMDAAVIGIYSRYQARKPTDWTLMEMPTDNIHRTGYFNIGGLDELNTLAFSPENPLFASFWTAAYNGIFRSNAVLKYIDTPTDYTGTQKNQYTGEALYLRALHYFDLVRLFGGVPKITTVLTIEETRRTGRATEDEIYGLIIDDLKKAVDLLPARNGIAKGRVNKSAAAALLGKVYVYRKDWNAAQTYLDMVEGQGFRLLPDYASLWKLENEDNDETLFAIKYIDGTNGQALSTDFLPYFGVAGIATRGNENVFPSWSLMKKFQKEDTRKAATVTEYWKSPSSPPGTAEIWYPYVSKFAVPHTAGASGLDLPVMRYAEVLLLRAETLYGQGKPDEALAALNKVRARAFKSEAFNYKPADIATPDDFLEKLLLERQLELALEGERWFDLVRTGKFLTVLSKVEWSYNPVTGVPQVVTLSPGSHQKYYPIPQSQMDLADSGVLKQNEGY